MFLYFGFKVGEKPGVVNIHHFCSQTNSVELPAHLTRVSRDMHTVDKHKIVSDRYKEPPVSYKKSVMSNISTV